MNTNVRLHKHQNNGLSKCVAKRGKRYIPWACNTSLHLSLLISLSSFLKRQKIMFRSSEVQKGPKVCCALCGALSDLTHTYCSRAP